MKNKIIYIWLGLLIIGGSMKCSPSPIDQTSSANDSTEVYLYAHTALYFPDSLYSIRVLIDSAEVKVIPRNSVQLNLAKGQHTVRCFNDKDTSQLEQIISVGDCKKYTLWIQYFLNVYDSTQLKALSSLRPIGELPDSIPQYLKDIPRYKVNLECKDSVKLE